jgi:hypothetical protein
MGALLIYHQQKQISSLETKSQVRPYLAAVRPRYGLDATSLIHHILEREARQVLTHVATDVGPNTQENALSFVITGAILMGFSKVACSDWSVNGGNDFCQGNCVSRPGEYVSSADAPLGSNQTSAFEIEKNLLEVGLGESGTFCKVTDRSGSAIVVTKSQTQQRPTGVVPSGRYSHGAILSTA